MKLSRSFRFGIFGWLASALLFVGIIPLAVFGIFRMVKTIDDLNDNMVKSLKSHTDWQIQQIDNNFHSVVGHLYFLSELPSVKRHLAGKNPTLQELEADILEFSRGHLHYGLIRVIDVSGHEVARANNKNNKQFMTSSKELEFVGNSQRFQELFNLSKGDIFIAPIEINSGRDFLTQKIIEVVTPVYKGEVKLGIILAQIYASRLFEWIHLPDTPFTSLLIDSNGMIMHLHEHSSSANADLEITAGRPVAEVFKFPSKSGNLPFVEGINYVDSGAMAVRPIILNNGSVPSWYIATFFPRAYLESYATTSKWYLAFSIFLVVLMGIAVALFVTKRFKNSFSKVGEGIDNISLAKFDEPLKLESGDEFEDMAEKLNDMRIRIKENQEVVISKNSELNSRLDYFRREVHSLEHQLYRANRLASVGELSLKLVHEIGNPLASIKTVTQIISEKLNGNEAGKEYFDKIVSEVDRLSLFLKRFNNFAVSKEGQLAPCDLGSLLKDVNFFLKVQAKDKGVFIEENFGSGPMQIFADLQQIKQLLMNLILNAIQATGQSGRIKITLRDSNTDYDCHLRENCFCAKESLMNQRNGLIELSICDTGSGIKKSEMVKIFNPFYTTKPNGTGLGLSIAHKIVETHNGTIRAHSIEGDGTTFRVYFPKYVENLISCPKD